PVRRAGVVAGREGGAGAIHAPAPGGSDRGRRGAPGRLARVVDLVPGVVADVEARSAGIDPATPVQDLVPRVVPHDQGPGLKRLRGPGPDPLPGEHVLGVRLEAHGVDRVRRVPEDADGRRWNGL